MSNVWHYITASSFPSICFGVCSLLLDFAHTVTRSLFACNLPGDSCYMSDFDSFGDVHLLNKDINHRITYLRPGIPFFVA
jgi:hypothetical protein